MNLRDLKYIIAVAETKHFGKAAQRCFVSQPTLSGQIKKLEQELGVAIFERSNRAVTVTPIGESILQHARAIAEQADSITQLAQAHRDPLAGPLRVGVIPTLSPYLVPLILLPLQKAYPQLCLVLSEEPTEDLIERLENHEIDTALLATTTDRPEFEEMALFDEPFWLAHPADYPMYTKEHTTLADLKKTKLLLLAEGHCLADQVMGLCHADSREQSEEYSDLRAASLETLLQLVGAGFGSTLVPALAMRGSWTSGSGVVARELEFKGAYRRVSLVYRKTFPRIPALTAFAEVITGQLPNTVRPIFPKKA